MSIPIDNYIKIVSSTVGGAAFPRRSTEFRMINSSADYPVGVVLEFSNSTAVGSVFGYNSSQYKFAGIYFGFISKSGTKPQSLSWFNAYDAATTPMILGTTTESLAAFSAVYNVTFSVGDFAESFAVDTTLATTSEDIATAITAALSASSDAVFTGAVCNYNVDTTRFDIVFGGPTGKVYAVSVAGDDAAADAFIAAVGIGGTATISLGQATGSYQSRMDECANISNNFFTFGLFTDVSPVEFATWADEKNNTFGFLHRFVESDYLSTPAYKSIIDVMLGQSGNALTQSSEDYNFSHFMPAMVCGATDYGNRGAAKNYMYQQDGAFDVYEATEESQALSLKDLGVNFYGQTQSGGNKGSFYQWGVMSGGSNDIKAQGPFFNEIWLKDAITVAIMNVFLATENLTANTEGNQRISSVITDICQNEAKPNGVISLDKNLTSLQKSSITEMTGDETAWMMVQSEGFWLDVQIAPVVDEGNTTYVGEYLLIYAKGDSVSKIDGRNVAI